MNWEAVSAVAEVMGVLVVIISILYLAAQVRQSAADVRANMIHSLHTHEIELTSKPSVDAILAPAIEKAHTGQRLSDEERAQYTMWVYSCLCHYQLIKLEYDRLKVADQTGESYRLRLSGLMKPALAKRIYGSLKDRFSPDMQAYVESMF